MSEVEEKVTIQAHNFLPSELALVAPDIAIEKYLDAGYRPSLRKFFEFKPVTVATGGISRYDSLSGQTPNEKNSVIGSSIVKSHGTTVIAYVSAQLIEDSFEAINDYRTKLESDLVTSAEDPAAVEHVLQYKNGVVYPVVEIAKGISGPPTSDEIEIGEQLYRSVLTSGCIPRSSLSVEIGLKTVDEQGNIKIIFKGEDDVSDELLDGLTDKTFSFVLEARVQVFGSTGAVYDRCHAALLKALRDTKLPRVYLTEKETILRARRGKSSVAEQAIEGYDLICDPIQYKELALNESKLSWNSTFGLLDIEVDKQSDSDSTEMTDNEPPKKASVLLADLEGDIESTIDKRVSVCVNKSHKIVSLQVQKSGGPGSNKITREAILQAITLASQRSQNMVSVI